MPFQLKEANFGNFGVCQLAEIDLRGVSSEKVGTALGPVKRDGGLKAAATQTKKKRFIAHKAKRRSIAALRWKIL